MYQPIYHVSVSPTDGNGTLPSAGICRRVENSFFKGEQPLEFPGPNKICTTQTTAVILIGSLVLSLPPHTLTL